MNKATILRHVHLKRFSAAAFAVLLIVGIALYANAHWRPLPQGTPKLSPEVEALRDQASSYVMQQPGRRGTGDGGEWMLVVTFVSEKNVAVNFSRSESGDLADSENEPYTLIPVGSSAEVLGCTITVLESHPKRSSGNGPGSATSSALIAVQCPEGDTPTAATPTARDEPSGTPTSTESSSDSNSTATP